MTISPSTHRLQVCLCHISPYLWLLWFQRTLSRQRAGWGQGVWEKGWPGWGKGRLGASPEGRGFPDFRHPGTFFFFFFLRPHLQHMEVPQLAVESELQLPATATATPDLSHICHLLHQSSWQRQILNPLNEARVWTLILMDTSQVYYGWATTGTPQSVFT